MLYTGAVQSCTPGALGSHAAVAPLEQNELFVLNLEDGRKAAFLWTGFDGMRTYQIRVSGPVA